MTSLTNKVCGVVADKVGNNLHHYFYQISTSRSRLAWYKTGGNLAINNLDNHIFDRVNEYSFKGTPV